MLKFRVQVCGTNPQGIAVVKHEQVFTVDLRCSEDAERDVLNMVAEHIKTLATDLERAATL